MKKVLKAAFEKLTGLYEISAKRKVAKRLLLLSDRQLEDIGVSRHKLAQGSAGYPWTLVNYTQPKLNVGDVIALNVSTQAVVGTVADVQGKAVAA